MGTNPCEGKNDAPTQIEIPRRSGAGGTGEVDRRRQSEKSATSRPEIYLGAPGSLLRRPRDDDTGASGRRHLDFGCCPATCRRFGTIIPQLATE